jgi:hypothetical protein
MFLNIKIRQPWQPNIMTKKVAENTRITSSPLNEDSQRQYGNEQNKLYLCTQIRTYKCLVSTLLR